MADTKISADTEATTIIDTDIFPVVTDIATIATNKKTLWSTIKSVLKTYFDNIYKIYHGIVRTSDALLALPTSVSTVFTLGTTAHPVTYWYGGVQVIVSTDKSTATFVGQSAGLYYVYFNTTLGTIAFGSFPGLTTASNVLIASVLWNGSDFGLVQDEMHSHDRNLKSHILEHFTVGCRYSSGLSIAITGSAPNNGMTVETGVIYDEDIPFTIPTSSAFPTANTYRIFYQTGATTYTFDTTVSALPYKAGTLNRPQYVDSSNAYALTTLPDSTNRYMVFFCYGATDKHTPIYVFTNTSTAALVLNGYTTLANARAIPWPNLSNMGLSREMRPVHRIIVRADGAVQAYSAVDDYRTVSSLPMAAGSAATTADIVSYVPTTPLTATNVQGALDQLAVGTAQTTSTIGTLINSAGALTDSTVADGDLVAIADVSTSNILSKITWANLKAAINSATATLTNKTLTSPKINEDVTLTTTATKLNYLTSATGTTGTATTNVVFSTSPALTTPTITTSITPASNDGASLGTASLQFSDLFLAEGGVINWDNGDATLTQSGDTVTLAGAALSLGTNALTCGAVTASGNSAIGTSVIPPPDAWRSSPSTLRVSSANSGGGEIFLASTMADASGSALGAVIFSGDNNLANYRNVVCIEASFFAGGTATKRGGELLIYTQADNTMGTSERVRINSTGLSVTGTVSPSKGVLFGSDDTTAETPGGVAVHSVVGLRMTGKAGSVFDYSVYTPDGVTALIYNPHGTGIVSLCAGLASFTPGTGLSVTGSVTASSTINAPPTNGTDQFSLSQTASLSSAQNVETSVFATDSFGGLLIVDESAQSGECAVYLVAGGVVKVVSQTGTLFSAVKDSGSFNLYLKSGIVTIQSKMAGTAAFRIMSLRIRPTSG